VQRALNKGYLRYHRTLLVKNNPPPASFLLAEEPVASASESSIFTQENSIPLVERSAFLL
jgi:hypothetical protein